MSADIQFSEFVKRQQRQVAVDNAIDWNKQRDEWLDYLQQLYNNIKEYLASYIDGGEITLRESTTEINEENIGVYSAKKRGARDNPHAHRHPDDWVKGPGRR